MKILPLHAYSCNKASPCLQDLGDIFSEVRITGKTGVEMEAITAATVCAITIYDMCKSADKGMIISDIHMMEKSGGKSGTFVFGKDS